MPAAHCRIPEPLRDDCGGGGGGGGGLVIPVSLDAAASDVNEESAARSAHVSMQRRPLSRYLKPKRERVEEGGTADHRVFTPLSTVQPTDTPLLHPPSPASRPRPHLPLLHLVSLSVGDSELDQRELAGSPRERTRARGEMGRR